MSQTSQGISLARFTFEPQLAIYLPSLEPQFEPACHFCLFDSTQILSATKFGWVDEPDELGYPFRMSVDCHSPLQDCSLS